MLSIHNNLSAGTQNVTGAYIRVIPYQFTEILHMTPSELDKIWYVSSPGGHMCHKGIHPNCLYGFSEMAY